VYSYDDRTLRKRPLYTFPNNQQTIGLIEIPPLSPLPPYTMHNVIVWASGFGILLDIGVGLLIPASLPNYCSRSIVGTSYIKIYASEPCIAGTFQQNERSSGPCLICPPGTMNDGSKHSRKECKICIKNNMSYCLRGALTETLMIDVNNFDQATPYSDSSKSTEFGDILLHNIFKLNTSSIHCLLISCQWWIFITIVIIGFVFVTMGILICFPKFKKYRRLLQKIFIKMDLIEKSTMWIGGIGSLLILVFIIFAIKFSYTFARLYSIEYIQKHILWKNNLSFLSLNTKFTSTLQLLSIRKHLDEQFLFDILDREQDFTLILQSVNTGFTCADLSMQEIMADENLHVLSKNYNCTLNETNGILSISTVLPDHRVTMQFNLNGPYFVGGLRKCFSPLGWVWVFLSMKP
ncbi:unnamed protein product, partial [Rotaria magnacalcarata]